MKALLTKTKVAIPTKVDVACLSLRGKPPILPRVEESSSIYCYTRYCSTTLSPPLPLLTLVIYSGGTATHLLGFLGFTLLDVLYLTQHRLRLYHWCIVITQPLCEEVGYARLLQSFADVDGRKTFFLLCSDAEFPTWAKEMNMWSSVFAVPLRFRLDSHYFYK